MSNFRALGFPVADRRALEGLARAPLRRSPGQMRLHQGESVQVHRLEIGDGIELWSVVKGKQVVASYPAFLAREPLPGVVRSVSWPRGPYTPRVRADGLPAPAFQLINALFVPDEALQAGVQVVVAVAAMLGQGAQPADPAARLGVADEPGEGQAENVVRLTGEVRAAKPFRNRWTEEPVCWLSLGLGAGQSIEAVAHAADLPELAPGERLTGLATVRGAIVEVLATASGPVARDGASRQSQEQS